MSTTTFPAFADVRVDFAPPPVTGLSDDAVMELQRNLAEIRRRVETASAAVAAEIAHRSRRDLGGEGLAQRLGARTPEGLIQRLTGGTSREAATYVRVGGILPVDGADRTVDAGSAEEGAGADGSPEEGSVEEQSPPPPEKPWLVAVADAVRAARLSVQAADAIRAGLGVPDRVGQSETSDATDGVTSEQLTAAAERLVREAAGCTVEQLAARARDARADLDAEHAAERIAEREEALRRQRQLRLFRQADGMTRISGLLDPESAAVVTSTIDAATSPRRGGPRFVDPEAVDRAERIVRDERTTEQIAADTLVELVRLGAAVAPTELLGSHTPAVQVLIAETDLRRGEGLGRIEGQTEPVSVATADRYLCEGGGAPIVLDPRHQVIDLGREVRRFTRRQRRALAARDGGCRFPRCDRPPAWTEAHHIVPWSLGGRTDIRDGVLLCRHHHLLLHNNGWRFIRDGGDYYVIPPRLVDPEQRPIEAPSKSGALRRIPERAAAG